MYASNEDSFKSAPEPSLLNVALSTKIRFAIIVLQMYCYYKCSVALPHGAVGWSAVCGCGIS